MVKWKLRFNNQLMAKYNAMLKESLQLLLQFLKILVVALLLSIFIRVFVVESYFIPSSSMENNLLIGDAVLASKCNYGVRLPICPYEIPMVEFICYLSGLHRYFTKIEWENVQLPGLSSVKMNDVVVFKYPENRRSIFIKRCVALSGDTVQIKHNNLFVNSTEIKNNEHIKNRYEIRMHDNENAQDFFTKLDIVANFDDYDTTFYANLDESELKQMKDKVKLIRRVEEIKSNIHVFPKFNSNNWNRDNYGPLWVPKKGLTIELNSENISLYKKIIEEFEENELDIKNSVIYINDTIVTSYTFKFNYFFTMGDNRQSSMDSRYWGFVPENYIIGKAVLVWWSYSKENGEVRWRRFFKRIK
jgi:signal peptidase I